MGIIVVGLELLKKKTKKKPLHWEDEQSDVMW